MFGVLKPRFRSLATLKLVYECCRQALNRKEQLRHRAVFWRQHGFVVNIVAVVAWLFKMNFTAFSIAYT